MTVVLQNIDLTMSRSTVSSRQRKMAAIAAVGVAHAALFYVVATRTFVPQMIQRAQDAVIIQLERPAPPPPKPVEPVKVVEPPKAETPPKVVPTPARPKAVKRTRRIRAHRTPAPAAAVETVAIAPAPAPVVTSPAPLTITAEPLVIPPLPQSAPASPPAPKPVHKAVIGKPGWARKPSAADLDRFYPERALRSGVEGRTVITCGVTITGAAQNCRVTQETPKGYGFGSAALRMSSRFRFTPQTRDGRPVAGGRITAPIVWALR